VNPLRWLLVPQAWQALQSRARVARQHGAGRLTVMLHLLWCVLAWSLLRLEMPGWQRLLQQRQRYYPQISPLRPRPLDVVRYAMQSLWLMLVLPLDNSARSERKRFNAFGPLFRWRQQFYQWLGALPAHMAKTGIHLHIEQQLQKLPPRVRQLLFIVAAIVASLLALLCISQPFWHHHAICLRATAVGPGDDGASRAGPPLYYHADCAVTHHFLSLFVVALH
jgi:hypothetical protein